FFSSYGDLPFSHHTLSIISTSANSPQRVRPQLLLPWRRKMARVQNPAIEAPTALAQNLVETLLRERVIPRFVDSYVVDNGRHALQVHASLYRDLLTILQREALLAACVRALEVASTEAIVTSTGKQRVVVRKGAESFRRKFLSALARQQNWDAGDSLDFQSDLRMYEDLLRRA